MNLLKILYFAFGFPFFTLIFIDGLGVAELGGRIYAVGGDSNSEAFDPLLNKWIPVAKLNERRYGHAVSWCDTTICELESAVNG